MSVTITIESVRTGTFSAVCEASSQDVLQANSYGEIQAAMVAHKETCEDCAYFGMFSRPDTDVSEDFELNMANGNAGTVLRLVGITPTEDGWCGEIEGADLLGRTLLALAALPEDAHALALLHAVGPAVRVSPGDSADYQAAKLLALHRIAREADRLGRKVYWG